MRKFYNKGIGIAALMAGIFIQGGGLSASASPYVLADRQAVTSSELDAMRGGFVTDNGLQFSLGITNAVLVGGVLQSLNSLNIPDISSILNSTLKNIAPAPAAVGSTSGTTPVPAAVGSTSGSPAAGVGNNPQTSPQNGSSVVTVQNSGTTGIPAVQQVVVPQASASTVVLNSNNLGNNVTLIQNSANNARIQNINTVNLITNSASIFRQLNFMPNVQQQLINMLH